MENEFNIDKNRKKDTKERDSIQNKIPVFEKIEKKLKPVFNYIEKNTSKVFMTLLILLLITFALNIFSTSAANSTLNEKAELIKEANKPIKIELTIIDCNECFDTTGILDSVKKQNVDILDETNLDSNSAEAKELILKYNIQKLPTIIISGEIDTEKVNFNDFELDNDALVLSNVNAPYLDLTDNILKGQVSITEIIDSSCDFCASLTILGTTFAESGVVISNWEKIEYNSAEAKELISKYNIKKIPTMLISNDINYYDGMKEILTALDATEKLENYVIHSITPPYRDLVKNKITGLVDLVMLTDNSCNDCYDVTINKPILTRLGIIINNENTYDISSSKGKELVSKYNIKKVPIIILSPEAKEYASFVSAWEAVGTKESDGWFIMRSPEVVGEIKEL